MGKIKHETIRTFKVAACAEDTAGTIVEEANSEQDSPIPTHLHNEKRGTPTQPTQNSFGKQSNGTSENTETRQDNCNPSYINSNLNKLTYFPPEHSVTGREVKTFAASSATKEEIAKSKARRESGKEKSIKPSRRIYRPKVTSQYEEPDCFPDATSDLEILFKDYRKPILKKKTALPPREAEDTIRFSKESHAEEFNRNIQWGVHPSIHYYKGSRIRTETRSNQSLALEFRTNLQGWFR